jgi:hypothetical protein
MRTLEGSIAQILVTAGAHHPTASFRVSADSLSEGRKNPFLLSQLNGSIES